MNIGNPFPDLTTSPLVSTSTAGTAGSSSSSNASAATGAGSFESVLLSELENQSSNAAQNGPLAAQGATGAETGAKQPGQAGAHHRHHHHHHVHGAAASSDGQPSSSGSTRLDDLLTQATSSLTGMPPSSS